MRVLLTGCTGYLGRVLLERMMRAGSEGYLPELFLRDGEGSGRSLAAATGLPAIEERELDAGKLRGRQYEAIIHLASSRSSTDLSSQARSLELTQKLISASLEAGIQKFVLASSQAVYGMSPPVWCESRSVAPASLYGLAKRAKELMCAAAGGGYVALRFAKLVGPSPQFRVDASELPHVLVAKSLESSPVVLQRPDQRLDLLDVRDAAEAILAVIQCQSLHLGVLNVGAGEHVTAKVVAEVVAGVALEKGLRLDYRLSPVTRPSRAFGMSIDRISELVGWKPSIRLEKTVSDVFDSAREFGCMDLHGFYR